METILFNKNHVKVTSNGRYGTNAESERINFTYFRHSLQGKGMTITVKREKWEDVVKESPLGFFYISNQKVAYEKEVPVNVDAMFHKITIYLKYKTYQIEYPISCNDVKVGFDARPWDICIGDLSMQEHFIKALKKILDDIFVSAAHIKQCERTKEKVYTELFGSVNGYSTLSNEIKILSHGFDLKESFRKRKITKVKKNGKKKKVCASVQ